MAYDWPGNVRELENIVEREIIINQGNPITFGQLSAPARPAAEPVSWHKIMNLDEVIKAHIISVLKTAGGRVEGEGGTADLLGVNPRTLQSRMKKLGIPFGRKAKGMYTQSD